MADTPSHAERVARLIVITYPGAELLDVTGPVSVFSTANQLAGRAVYAIVVASPEGGPTRHSGGVVIDTTPLRAVCAQARDTVLVVGAVRPVLDEAMRDRTITNVLLQACQSGARYGSVCSGAFLVGSAGLLDGHDATTHWAARYELAARFSKASVARDTLYVQSGRLWTSAGVSAGIDMALAMVGADHGAGLKTAVARNLVVYAHRSGHQSQFSDLMVAQSTAQAPFLSLIEWVGDNLSAPIRVEDMAERSAMSVRTFHRKFSKSFGLTPARFVERLRLERARDLVAAGLPVKRVCRDVGFHSEAAFRQAFKTRFGIPPSVVAHMSA